MWHLQIASCTSRNSSPLTFLATKSTMSRATAKQPAAILVVRRFVDASMKIIPQNDEPRSEYKLQNYYKTLLPL